MTLRHLLFALSAAVPLAARGLPTLRTQTVADPEGNMRVTERYLRFDVEP